MCIRTYIHNYLCLSTYLSLYIYIYICMYMCIRIYIYIYKYIYIYILSSLLFLSIIFDTGASAGASAGVATRRPYFARADRPYVVRLPPGERRAAPQPYRVARSVGSPLPWLLSESAGGSSRRGRRGEGWSIWGFLLCSRNEIVW